MASLPDRPPAVARTLMMDHERGGNSVDTGPKHDLNKSANTNTATNEHANKSANTNTATNEHANVVSASEVTQPLVPVQAPSVSANETTAPIPSVTEVTAPIPRVFDRSLRAQLARPAGQSWPVLLGLSPDPALLARGLVGHRVRGVAWQWEHREQAVARAERVRHEREVRERARVFSSRVVSLSHALAPRLGVDQADVDLWVPVEYDTTSARTGDVVVRRGDTRLRESSDPADVSTLAPVRLGLPDGFHPEAKSLLAGLIREYLGGEWSAKWYLTTYPHYAEFSRDRARPAPPKVVQWKVSDDPYLLHIGHDGVQDIYIPLKTDAPHIGISADSGKGKTTTILLPLQHARAHGALVDVIDMKEDSLDRAAATRQKNRFNVDVFRDVSGVRIHRDVRSGIAALVEYYVSAKSLRLARESGYDMSTVPHRYLIIDEFGSFMQVAKNYWDLLKMRLKAAKQEVPGNPPFMSWFHQILMQGRSKDHRVVLGTHDYDEKTFGGTNVRKLVGAKMLIRDNTYSSHVKAFGQGTKRIKINENINGRAMIQMMPGAPVNEIQLAFTPEAECLEFLLGLPLAPEWFDNGEIAPWITPESIARSHEEAFVLPFLPAPDSATAGDLEAGGGEGGTPPVLPQGATSRLKVALTESEQRDREDAEILTQREILERGYLLPLIREAEARQPGRTPDELVKSALKVMQNARDRGQFPEAIAKGTGGNLYRVGDVREWERNRSNRVDFSDTATGKAIGED